eukprot:CAMPEP_0180662846 /NCGR_PEP_ID=MMETSP1037_2-20121125/59609_1 /TAXON_ID=632150 /ORGANISM="Azadinium spinosum, Strain 3D9" /LENGTH=52 /DNA_ID=CAMNT_0022690535 /DNA_START=104 /DNA_END=259 /DNA_ORIENTATION=-
MTLRFRMAALLHHARQTPRQGPNRCLVAARQVEPDPTVVIDGCGGSDGRGAA